tara:strand:- start:536 stop:769 length:234 start_codon:yes stop_codon:yes gene_type:complete
MSRRIIESALIFSGLEEYISGIILFEETLGHKTSDGTLFTEILKKKNIIIGIKVDKVNYSTPSFPTLRKGEDYPDMK